jgi:filamentous hemagglutinin family protein
MSTTTALGSQWLYKLIKHSSSILFGLVLASAAPLLPAQAATEARSPITQNLSQLDSSLQDSGAGTDSLRFTPEVGPVAEPSFLVAQSITAAEDGTGTVVTQTDNTFDITGGTQEGNNLFHSFEQLGLDSNQIANILSGSDINNILGRVVGGDASVINGLLQVTGGNSNLYLMNPAGIVFGPNAQVITPGSFSASTADAIQIGDEWFNAMGSNEYGELVGEPSGYAFAEGDPGAVINAGNLSAGESVTLLGGVVVNTGTVETPGGTINISAVPGENLVSITQGGNLLSIALPVEAQAGLNGESQGLAAEDISALLSGAGMAGSLGVVVEDGVTKLVSTGTPIPTSAGTAIVAGTLDVADNSVNGTGGAIDVLGERVALLDATLQASGTTGGGTVRVGGDYRGQGQVANAERTYVDDRSAIAADALAASDGGRVVVWADDTTRFYGDISARGGAESGDGGFAEVSGRENLAFDGIVDLAAPNGSAGTLLLDPRTITISERTSTSGDESVIDSRVLVAQTGNVSLEATDGITIDKGLSLTFIPCSSSPCSISFNADSDNNRVGSFAMDRTQSITALGRSIKIAGANITAGDIRTKTGFIASSPLTIVTAEIIQTNLNATAGSILVGNINGGGDVSLSADKDIFTGYILNTIFPLNAVGRTIPTFNFTDRFGGLGGVSLSTINGDIRVSGIDTEPGYINISSGGLFQATRVLEGRSILGTSYPSRDSERIDINDPENQEVRNGLISAGYLSYANGTEGRDFLVNTSKVRETLLASLTDPAERSKIAALSDADLASLFLSRDGDRALISPNRQATPISLIVRGSTVGNFVKIAVGGTTVIDTASNIVSSNEFVIGPLIGSLKSQDLRLNLVRSDDFSSELRLAITSQDYSVPLIFGSERFPNTVSGAVGTILLSLGENNGFAGTALQPVEYQPPSPPPKGKTDPSDPRENSTDDENQAATLQANAEDEEDSENDACEMFEPTEVLSVSEVAPEECQSQEISEASE